MSYMKLCCNPRILRSIYVVLILLVIFTTICGCSTEKKVEKIKPAQASFVPKQVLLPYFSKTFEEQGQDIVKGKISCGVVPHHLVAGELIAEFMKALALQKPEVIILIGPNHPNAEEPIITGSYDWETPEGIVNTNEEIVQKLLSQGKVAENNKVLAKEHSVGNLMPFVKHYMPETEVVPLILHHDVTFQEVDDLLEILNPYLEQKAVLVGSVDFSHYLTRAQAEEKDKETLKVMQNFDYLTLAHMGNDHLDSPASLACVLRVAESKDIKEFQVLANTNSGVIMENDLMETTSYFTLIFREKDK